MKVDLGAVGTELIVLLAVEAVLAVAALIAIGRWAYRRRRQAPPDVPPVVGFMLNDVRARVKQAVARWLVAARGAVGRGAQRVRSAVPGGDRFFADHEPERS